MTNTYTSVAHKDGGWWVVQNEQFPGAISQVTRLGDAAGAQTEAIGFVTGVPVDVADVSVRVRLNDEIDRELAEITQLKAEAQHKQARAARLRSHIARELKTQGLTVRDIGVVLGVSYQRAHQLVSE